MEQKSHIDRTVIDPSHHWSGFSSSILGFVFPHGGTNNVHFSTVLKTATWWQYFSEDTPFTRHMFLKYSVTFGITSPGRPLSTHLCPTTLCNESLWASMLTRTVVYKASESSEDEMCGITGLVEGDSQDISWHFEYFDWWKPLHKISTHHLSYATERGNLNGFSWCFLSVQPTVHFSSFNVPFVIWVQNHISW